MSKPGTTWFKRSGRKFAALVAGAAILTGAAGVASPQADASTWSFTSEPEPIEIVVDGDRIDAEIAAPKPETKPKPRPWPWPIVQGRSTWS